MVTAEEKVKKDIEGVKIENINIPFWALVGLMLKVYFAWIVATVFLALLPLIIFFGGSLILAIINSAVH